MTREEMVNTLVEMFESSDEESLMFAAEPKENLDGTYDLRITDGDKKELFTMHSELGQTIGELHSSFASLISDAIHILTGDHVEFQYVDSAEF